MILHASTRLGSLLRKYPFLADFLAARLPRLDLLRSPLKRTLLARSITLEKAAAMGGQPVGSLLAAIAAEIRFRTGEEVAAAAAAEAPGEDAIPPPAAADSPAPSGADATPGGDAAPSAPAGHPVHTYMEENRLAGSMLDKMEAIFRMGPCGDDISRLVVMARDLAQIERHYRRQENQLYPMLEARGIGKPAEGMAAVHAEIGGLLQKTLRELEKEEVGAAWDCFERLCRIMRDMADREERLLFPLALEALSDADWVRICQGEEAIGYAWLNRGLEWQPDVEILEPRRQPQTGPGAAAPLPPGRGALPADLIDQVLRRLPVEITFINERDEVAYYSENRERILPRAPDAIGRKFQEYRPPAGGLEVERLLADFRAGIRDTAEFQVRLAGRLARIRYFAIRDAAGGYRGALEVCQEAAGTRSPAG